MSVCSEIQAKVCREAERRPGLLSQVRSISMALHRVLVLTCFHQLCRPEPGVLCISRAQGVYILLTPDFQLILEAEKSPTMGNQPRCFSYDLMDTRIDA
jgi:hypothetical protein